MANSKKKIAKGSKPKKGLNKMSQTHAMEQPKKYTPSTLDQVWGDTGLSKYQTLDIKVYKQQLDDYNKSDLQAHAKYVGLLPLDNATLLKNRLINEFERHVASYRRPPDKPNANIKLSAEAKKILSEGR